MKKFKLLIFSLAALSRANAQSSNATVLAVAPVSETPAISSSAAVTSASETSPFSLVYFNYMNGPALREAANGMSINHYLTTKYKFQNKWAASFTLRPDTNHNNGEAKDTVLADPYLRIEYPTLFEAKNGLKVTGNCNYFVPSSDASKESKSNGSITTRFLVAKDIARWSLSYLLIPRFYMWKEKEDGQTLTGQVHYLTASYNLSDFVSFDFGVAPEWQQKRNAATAFNDLPAYPGATINFSKYFSVSPYLEIPLMKAEQEHTSIGTSVSYRML